MNMINNTQKNNSIDLDINVNREQLDDTIEELRELKDTKPNITIRNNQNVYVTINNFNEPEKEWSKEAEQPPISLLKDTLWENGEWAFEKYA